MSARSRLAACGFMVVGALASGHEARAATTEIEGSAGFSQRFLYRVPIELGTLSIAPGVRYSQVTVSFPLWFDGGSTLEGLTVYSARMGVGVEHVLERVRIGYGVSFGGLFIRRATGGRFFAGVWDFVFRVSIDVARFGSPREIDPAVEEQARSAVFVALAMHVDTLPMFGPSLSVGVRY